ncbi:hypothetical protein [Qipengyuania flava]|uniref:hypothetical protein n=1 Tax=Qipengyuania flava TaxID=192812 RepID=UPI00273E179F|nr:hypothetical protein [Qipengyuania flava]
MMSFDFFELDTHLMAVERNSGRAWVWMDGTWISAIGNPSDCYATYQAISCRAFAKKYPVAARSVIEAR